MKKERKIVTVNEGRKEGKRKDREYYEKDRIKLTKNRSSDVEKGRKDNNLWCSNEPADQLDLCCEAPLSMLDCLASNH